MFFLHHFMVLNVKNTYIQTIKPKEILDSVVETPSEERIWMGNLVYWSRFFIHIFDGYLFG